MSKNGADDPKHDQSRRLFLKGAAGAAVGAALTSGLPGESAAAEPAVVPPPPAIDLDVAIIGAGVAGCYTAYRILQGLDPLELRPGSPMAALHKEKSAGSLASFSVGLFEYAGRVGGRLLSPHVPGIPGYTSEFGGFRFNHQMHIVWDTAKHLGLTDQVFHFDGQPEQNQNFVYVRGKRLTWAQVNAGQDLPYDVRPDEQGLSPDDLETLVANRVLADVLPDVHLGDVNPPPGYTSPLPPTPNGYSALYDRFHTAFNVGDWQKVREAGNEYERAKLLAKPGGRPLELWTWWALKRHFLSQEAVDLIEDTGGYDESGTSGNVGSNNLDEDFYFPATTGGLSIPCSGKDDDECTMWRHIREGYAAIPGRLEEGFRAKGGQTFLNHQLVRFDQRPDGQGYDLLFYLRTPGPGTVETDVAAENLCKTNPSSCLRVRTRILILALPKRGLELVDQDNFFFQDPSVQGLIQSAGNVPAMRMFLAYPEPWWNFVYSHSANGRSTTDLGVRQFYYWFTEKDGKALVLATYTNGQSEEYWQSLEGGQPYDALQGTVQPIEVQGQDVAFSAQRGGPRHASTLMAEEAHRQIMQVVGVNQAPRPYYAHFQNWTKDPWGAGWHNFNVGTVQYETISRMRQPIPKERVFVVGETYSNVQGWVQGALNAAEATLQCNLGLAWPAFLRRHGTWLGPGTKWLVGDEDDPCLDRDTPP